jgi:hypothetical protein
MALFAKADAVAAIRRDFDAAVAARSKLVARLDEAKAAADAATLAAHRLAGNDATDAALDKAEGALRAAQDRTATLTAALVHSDERITKLNDDLAAAVDAKARRNTVVEIAELETEFQSAMGDLEAAFGKLEPALARLAAFIPEASALLTYSQSSRLQMPDALALISRLLADHGVAVANGTAPAALKVPPVAAPKAAPVAAPPPMTTVFATRSIKFTDPNTGKLVLVKQFQDAEMPPAHARIALDLRVCVRLDDPVRRQNHGSVAGHAEPAHAFDLDLAMEVPRPAVVPIKASSPFTIVDRGPAVTIPLRVATRSEPS